MATKKLDLLQKIMVYVNVLLVIFCCVTCKIIYDRNAKTDREIELKSNGKYETK